MHRLPIRLHGAGGQAPPHHKRRSCSHAPPGSFLSFSSWPASSRALTLSQSANATSPADGQRITAGGHIDHARHKQHAASCSCGECSNPPDALCTRSGTSRPCTLTCATCRPVLMRALTLHRTAIYFPFASSPHPPHQPRHTPEAWARRREQKRRVKQRDTRPARQCQVSS